MKKIARCGFYALLACVALLALAELAVRTFVPMDALVYQDSRDAILRFELKPGAQGWKNGTWVKINGEGMRQNSDVPEQKKPGEFRVLVVGGYLSFGTGVALDDTYVQRLRALIHLPKDKTLDLVNLSMYSYDLPQKIEMLRARGALYDPDFVVFEISGDDLKRMPPAWIDAPGLKNAVREHSRLARWIMETLFRRRNLGHHTMKFKAKDLDASLTQLQDLLSRQMRVPALVLYLPDISVLPQNDPAYQEAFSRGAAAECRGLGLAFHDLGPDFKGYHPDQLLLRRAQPFLNSLGQQITGKAAAAQINAILRRAGKKARPRRKASPESPVPLARENAFPVPSFLKEAILA